MKWTSTTWNFSQVRKTFQSASSVGKTFMVLSTSTLALFVLIGLGGVLQSRANDHVPCFIHERSCRICHESVFYRHAGYGSPSFK